MTTSLTDLPTRFQPTAGTHKQLSPSTTVPFLAGAKQISRSGSFRFRIDRAFRDLGEKGIGFLFFSERLVQKARRIS